jgi:hypothetical protein
MNDHTASHDLARTSRTTRRVGRVKATVVNSDTICLNSTLSDLRNFLRAGTL